MNKKENSTDTQFIEDFDIELCPLEQWMIVNGLSSPTVAKMLNVGDTTVYNWIKGDTSPSHGHFRRVVELISENNDYVKVIKFWRKWRENLNG